MKKLWSLLQHRVVWTSGVALLVIVTAPGMVRGLEEWERGMQKTSTHWWS